MKRDKQYNERLFKSMRNPHEIDRRGFMKRIGGGLVVAFSIGELPLSGRMFQDGEETPGVNAYLRIGEDGRVKLFVGKVELGQGPITSLPMELADELDVKLEVVDMVMADTDLCPWDEGTYGSLSTRTFGQVLRAAAAKARALLLEMAARELSVDIESLDVKDGVVTSTTLPQKSISYAELTKGKEILETSDGKAKLKKPSEFKIMGKPRFRVDAREKVTGEAKYAGDIQLPGLMRARILRPPSLGAKLTAVDTSAAEAMEGVKVVKDGDLVAALHASTHVAELALGKIEAEWEETELDLDHESIYDHIMKVATESRQLDSGGDLSMGESEADRQFDITYKDPYIAHSPIENHTATAVIEEGRMKVWASCQTPYPTKEDIAEEVGMDLKDVQLLPIFVGGGFGGKIYNPQALEVARLAKLTGKPVQLVYSRKEEFMYDRYRPAAVVKIKSGLNKEGRITNWDYAVHQGGGREAPHFYDIPHHRTRAFFAPQGTDAHPLYTGAWRAPSVNTNTFARESQIDIMAAAAGVDPLEFRLRHLENNPRMSNVLKKGAERFGWTPAKGPSGRGFGMAAGVDVGTDVVVFVEVEVDTSTGHVQVKRALSCQDMGIVVNPQGAIIQAEGCMFMGLGYALREEIHFEGKKVLTTNFDNYGITQFNMVPEVEAILVDSKDEVPYGGGEPPIVCMGAVVANAIFDATGARLLRQPFTPERVLEAIKSL
ncbi:MAG: molybdopterin cofactor-binding domain-containing protein [Bacteroidota bacterium]|nr:molybdopterin cofactor-binding domain-containing protein [Bacteroidota bacterium]